MLFHTSTKKRHLLGVVDTGEQVHLVDSQAEEGLSIQASIPQTLASIGRMVASQMTEETLLKKEEG